MSNQPLNHPTFEKLLTTLENPDGLVRLEARKELVSLGPPVVPALGQVLKNSPSVHARWEAAKTLGEIGDPASIPALVDALEEEDADVAWLITEALRHFHKAAWAPVLNALLKKGSESIVLCKRTHHVFAGQKDKDYDHLLEMLRKTLDGGTMREGCAGAAFEILKKMGAIS